MCVHAMNKRFIFPCNIRLGNSGLIYHGSVSEDKLVHDLQNFEPHQRLNKQESMIASDIISITLLLCCFWTVYNGSIIYVGVRNKRNQRVKQSSNQSLPRISLIVPTKNEETVIRRCLDGILTTDYPKDKMQVIIVDGNSSDNTCEVCSEFSEKYPNLFKVITEAESRGKPSALNLALPHITGELVGTFDADSLPERDALKKVASYFDDEKIMAVQGRTTSINEKRNALTRVIAMEEKAWFQMLLAGREKLQLFVPLMGAVNSLEKASSMKCAVGTRIRLTEDVEFALRLVEKRAFNKVCS
jgi:cellulose synthase/poly-beta-1,6-N-acetylglucosamine synthase-like glycosyltransferase